LKKLLILFLIFVKFSSSQELTVSVDKNPAIVGEQILIKYIINQKGDNFKSPNFNGLRILSGPNPSTQSSYTFVNGKSESKVSTTYSFYAQATKEGKYKFSAASITVGNKKINSNEYELTVVKGKNPNSQNSNDKNLFIKVDVSKKNIVVGEQILVTYKLYTRLDLQNTELTKLPDLNGFWSKDLETSSRFKRDVLNGTAYNTAIIKKSVLTAQKKGKLTIDPLEIKCGVRTQNQRSNDPFANFFGNNFQIREQSVLSNKIDINVSELEDPPTNFNGAVGSMNISSELDLNIINANEALTYKLTITGTGNIDLIKTPIINFPNDFEVYDPNISEKIFEGGRKRSIKTFEYLIIPRFEGAFEIPEYEFVYFDTKKNKFIKKYSLSHKVQVEKSLQNEQNQSIQKTLVNSKEDINYIYLNTNFKKINSSELLSYIFYLLFAFPVFLLILINFYFKRLKTKVFDKHKNANKIALKKLSKAKICINENNYDKFFEEIEKSLWGYFSDKFKVSIADLSKENIDIFFSKYSINEKIKDEFIGILDTCELSRYTPVIDESQKMDEILEQAKNTIIKLEIETK
jgi:hypothetical protein